MKGRSVWVVVVFGLVLAACLHATANAAQIGTGSGRQSTSSKPTSSTTRRGSSSGTGTSGGSGSKSGTASLFANKKVDLTTFVPKLTLRLIPSSLKLDRGPVPQAPPTPLDQDSVNTGVNVVPIQPKLVIGGKVSDGGGGGDVVTADKLEAELHGPDETREKRRVAAPSNPRSPDCPMQPRWAHSAAYLYGSVYVFGGISTISVPSTVPLHNDIWSFGAQQWDLYQADQDTCPWPAPPPPSPKMPMYRPDTAPPFPFVNETEMDEGQDEDAGTDSPLSPVDATVTKFSLLEVSSRERLHAISPDPKYFQPYVSVKMPRDDLWQYDLATRKWSQPATVADAEAEAAKLKDSSGSSSSSTAAPSSSSGGNFRFASSRFRSLRGGGRRSRRSRGSAFGGGALLRGNGQRSGTFGGAMSRQYAEAQLQGPGNAVGVRVPAAEAAATAASPSRQTRFRGGRVAAPSPGPSSNQPPPLKTTDHFPDPNKSPYKQLKVLGPTARWLHTMVVMDKKLIVFGGVTHDYVLHDDVWAFDPEYNAWDPLYAGQAGLSLADSIGLQQYTPASIQAVIGSTFQISPREGHSAVVVKAAGFGKAGTDSSPATMLVYGGISGSLTPADRGVWAFVTKPKPQWTWSVAATPKQKGEPPTRWLHAASPYACKKPPCMIVFGGCSPHLLALNDVWLYSMSSNTFTQLKPTGAQLPPGRWLHSMVGVRAPKLGVTPRYVPTLEEYDLHEGLRRERAREKGILPSPSPGAAPKSTKSTKSTKPTTTTPTKGGPVFLETAAQLLPVDPPSSKYGVPTEVPSGMMVFGGAADQNLFFSDSWLLTVTEGTGTKPGTCFWELMNPVTGSPEAREGHAAVVVEVSEASPGPSPSPPPAGRPPTEAARPMQGSQWMLVIGGFSGDASRTLPDLPTSSVIASNDSVIPTSDSEAKYEYTLENGKLVKKKEVE